MDVGPGPGPMGPGPWAPMAWALSRSGFFSVDFIKAFACVSRLVILVPGCYSERNPGFGGPAPGFIKKEGIFDSTPSSRKVVPHPSSVIYEKGRHF